MHTGLGIHPPVSTWQWSDAYLLATFVGRALFAHGQHPLQTALGDPADSQRQTVAAISFAYLAMWRLGGMRRQEVQQGLTQDVRALGDSQRLWLDEALASEGAWLPERNSRRVRQRMLSQAKRRGDHGKWGVEYWEATLKVEPAVKGI